MKLDALLLSLLLEKTNVTYLADTFEEMDNARKSFQLHCFDQGFLIYSKGARLFHSSGAYIFFGTARVTGAACEHTQVLVLEDSESMEPKCLEEALLIPSPLGGHEPLIIKVDKRNYRDT